MLDFFRTLRQTLYNISSCQIGGFQIDTALHLLVGFAMVLIFSRFFKIKTSVYLSLGLIAAKEVADLFLKSRLEYVRPPKLDLLYDVVFGILGVAAGYWVVRRRNARRS